MGRGGLAVPFIHWFDPINTSIQWAAWWGAAFYLVARRNFGWSVVLPVVFITQILAFYVTIPFAMWRGWSMGTYIFIAFCIGAVGFLISGAIFNVLQSLHDDPQGTVSFWWRLWRGLAPRDDPKDGGGA